MSSAICFNLEQSNILSSDNGLSTYTLSTTMRNRPLENILRKGENADQYICSIFSFSPKMFSALSKKNILIYVIFGLSSANAFHFNSSMILSFDKDLTPSQTSPCF